MVDYSEEIKKYHILTYGCQMNVRDSEIIAGLVESMGYIETNSPSDADLVIFNTCSVRHSAENKVYGKLGEINKFKKNNKELLIAFGGCMAQLNEVQQKLKNTGVDILFGTHNVHELPRLIEEANQEKNPILRVWDKEGTVVESLPSKRKEGISAFVNIMYGCNNFCSYCIVPYTRGRERSREPQDIVAEIKELAELGYKEVTLLGQNVNSYGKGLQNETDFSRLLYKVNEINGIERIRFTTSHPKDMSDNLIDAIRNNNKVCEHIHVPLQAGSNKVLKLMNRNYTRDHYLELTKRMRDRIPGVSITSDLIVGFPGETEQDFEDTLDMVDKVKFDAAFTFMYSVRTGTKAASLEEQIELETKKERLNRLNKLQYSIATEINKSLEGKTVEILVEGTSKTNTERLTGRTRCNRIIIFSGSKDLIGQLINVRIEEGKTFSLFGDYVS
ncbi:tRNA-i(6)A37 methylthiotransferase [Candidatus Syntrophocurvum alkaliphilum]|uniref:tRNA-2-methylthio-N(6)-dimethylallyladenosine synthase n=1 Tax=Candidatus Syntrophocurvum alkaliphilum TaxID=2293317 RepID=A0A6I6DAR9_9FIRM|nr:tRNA (N6-isopentenyl adenosine(37)-C2)-methylthiotransferase MiaB [Candidatus Syntrophocurvum alkaliphilum]QGT99439.1 tRNA-i(6)A37 methylthiotransferase [Candidatus Syntrophocurvum alkaliphilum]